jgi:hypothetical protein
VLGFLCGGETWSRVGPPIPSSPVNSMAKGAPKHPAVPQKSGVAVSAPAATAAPKTTGSVNPAPAQKPAAGQKQAAGQPADPVGDICLLPDIARFTH